jgi:predicted dehydrogenase
MDVGCYCVNISRMIAGQDPTEVQAYANWGVTGVDEQMACSLRFANGLLAQFDCGLVLSHRQFYQVVGTKGVLDVPVAFNPGTSSLVIRQEEERNEVVHQIPGDDEYRLMVEYFSSCVLNNEPLRYPTADAIANMRVIDALYRSARNDGRPEPVSGSTASEVL